MMSVKGLCILSAGCAAAAFFLGIAVVEATSFYATGGGKDLYATMQEMRVDGQYMALWNFCNDDHSPCSGDKCSNYEDKLCGLHATSVIMVAVAMVCEALTCIFMLGVALNYTHLCMTPAHKAKGMAQCCMFMQVLAAVMWAILIPLWGSAKAELPDLHCDTITGTAPNMLCAPNSKVSWKYEPAKCANPSVNCGLEWSLGVGWGMLFLAFALALVSAGTAFMGAQRTEQSMEEAPIVAAIGQGAGTGESLITGGKVAGPRDGDFTEYNDQTL